MTETTTDAVVLYATVRPKTLDRRLLWLKQRLFRARKNGLTMQGWDQLFASLDSMIEHAAELQRGEPL